MNKSTSTLTNAELAREAGMTLKTAYELRMSNPRTILDRYTELVEARLMAKLLEGVGEPVAWMNPYGGLLHQCRTGLEKETFTIPLHTPEQIAAAVREAVLRERIECAKICERFQARDVGMQSAECAAAIRNRGTK